MKHMATITATDNIGRITSITLLLDDCTIRRLICAEYTKANPRETINELRTEINRLIEENLLSKYYGTIPEISDNQRRRLNDFFKFAYNRFGGFTLHIDANV